MGMWEKIDKLSALDEYKNSFNGIINDALRCGLSELHDIKFGKVEEKSFQPREEKTDDGEIFLKIVRLLREVIINENVNKSIMCSLFNLRQRELDGTTVGTQLSKGYYQDTPDFLSDYEIRELKKLRD